MPRVFYDSAEVYNWHDGNFPASRGLSRRQEKRETIASRDDEQKNNLRTIAPQIVQKLLKY